MDQATEIRKRLRELTEGTGFPAHQVAEEMGPEAAEIEFADRFKRQMVARQAKQDRERAAREAKEMGGRQQAARDAAATASPRDMTTELVPPGDLRDPRTDAARAQDDLGGPETDGELTVPGIPSAPRRYSAEPMPKPRPPAPSMMQEGFNRTAQMARARQQGQRPVAAGAQHATAPGGLNVSPEQVAEMRAAAQEAARRPAPAQSGKAELQERETRARESREIQEYQVALAQYDAAMREWRTQLEEAFDTNNDVRAQQLAANEPVPPEAPLSVTGGLESNEFRPVFDHDNDPSTPRIAETAGQTLARLQQANPAAYEALRRTAQIAVGTPRLGVDAAGQPAYQRDSDGNVVYDADPDRIKEWFANQFGEMEPSERYDAMALSGGRLATSTPQLAVPDGSATGIGAPGRAKSAPRAYDDSQLDPRTGKPMVIGDTGNQSRTETMPGAGRLSTPGGMVTRAPENSGALESMGVNLDTFPVNPEQMTPQWREQMLAIGMMGFGMDRNAYAEGPDGDSLYIAAVQKALEGHQQKKGAGFDTQRVVTGGTRYKPGAEMEKRRAVNTLRRQVNDWARSNSAAAAAVDPATGVPYKSLLLDAAANGDANAVRDLTAAARAEGQANRDSTLAAMKSREADEQNRQNPRRAPGMFRDSLQQAGNDPRAIAAVYRDWGMPEEAERILAMENQRFGIEMGGRVGMAQADAARERGDVELLQMQDNQILDGLLNPDATQPMNDETAIDSYARLHPKPDGTPLGREDAMKGVGRLIVRSGRPNASAHPIVQGVLNSLFAPIWQSLPGARSDEPVGQGWWDTKREFFQRQANAELGMDPETSGREFDRLQDAYRQRQAGAPAE